MTPILAATASENAELIVFIVLAPLAVVSALGMVLSRNAVYSALLLVVNFFCLAGFYVLLEAQFVAAVQVIVYAGAIMVLFLFVLMLLGIGSQEAVRETIKGQRPAAVLLTLGLLVAIVAALAAGVFDAEPASLAAANEGGNVQAVGRLLFTRYTFAFETAGVLLVVAAVGALVLGKRQRP
ncbi:MAG TPA: NADH-quinone oxidoreductase subunit J [Actinomycetes bacterium]|nr:NADH-quinone oxidoreductase subunit J [Actinomycetes bacterium]